MNIIVTLKFIQRLISTDVPFCITAMEMATVIALGFFVNINVIIYFIQLVET